MDVFFYKHQKLIFSSKFVKKKIRESKFSNEIFSSDDHLEIHLSKNIEIYPSTLCGLLYGGAIHLRIRCWKTSTSFLLYSTATDFEDKKNFFLEVYEKLDVCIPSRIEMVGSKIAKIFRGMEYPLFLENGKITIDSPKKLIFQECGGVYIFKNLRGEIIPKDNERKVFLESGKYFDDEKKMLAKNYGGEYFSFVKNIIL